MKLFLLALLCAFSTHALALDITDDRGVTVHFDKPPQRIVSLLPSLTETVCELGQCARLVGVDRYSNFPAQAKALPQLGGGIDSNIEAVVAQGRVVHHGPCNHSATHAALVQVFEHRITIQPLLNQWVVLPKL